MVDVNTILSNILTGFSELFSAPFQKLEIWWYLFPIIGLWFILEVYFSQHKKEKMGWNTALGNGFSLTWVTIEAMRGLFEHKYDPFALRFIIIFLIMAYGLFLIYVSFNHKFKEKIAFAIAGATPTYFLSGTLILWAHNTFQLTLWTFVDLIILFIISILFTWILRKILPEKQETTSDDHMYESFGFDQTSSSIPQSNQSFPEETTQTNPNDQNNAFKDMFS